MSAVPRVFGSSLTLATFVLVVEHACFNSGDQFFFLFSQVCLGVRVRFTLYV